MIRLFPGLAVLMLVALAACDLSDEGSVSLRIETPTEGTSYSNPDDVDSKAEGFQIAVRVGSVGLRRGTLIELVRLKAGEPESQAALASIENGEAVFAAFTLQPGVNELQARVQGSERVSDPVSVVFDNRCGSIAFVEPARIAKDAIRLGPVDDRDQEACGDTFTTRVVASTGLSDGTDVSLLVNGSAGSSAKTSGGVATFDDVVLGNRGATPNRLALQVSGSDCNIVSLDADVFVDCVGPSCVLGGPPGTELSSAQDKDRMSAGLQVDFEVRSDASGQGVRLLINGDVDNAKAVETQVDVANFSSVSLPEGKGVRVKAICSGENGATSSSERLFNVDTTSCSVSILEPSASAIFVADQLAPDGPPEGRKQIEVAAAVGSDCVSFRAIASTTSDCADIESGGITRLAAGQTSVDAEVALETQGAQDVCVQVADSAGNTASTTVRVTFDKQPPALTITNPATTLSINREGTLGREADLNPATPACERPVGVSCGEPGTQVQIVTQPEGVLLATALCTAGVAEFASVPLPSQNDGRNYTIIARSKGASGLVGNSEPRAISADCQRQTLAFSNVTCGVTSLGETDDADPSQSGIQYDLLLENNPVPRPKATLSIDGVAAVPSAQADATEGVTVFKHVTFARNTKPKLKACVTDGAGNAQCTDDCVVIIGNVPKVALTVPSAGARLTRDLSSAGVAYLDGVPLSSDCDPGTPGLQIEVRATTDAPEGRTARITLLTGAEPAARPIASRATSVVAGEVAGCISSEDGDGLVIRVEVDHSDSNVFGVAIRTVSIDGNAPTTSLTLANDGYGCRHATLSFREVLDAPGALGTPRKLAGFERRCAYGPILTEAAWSNATRVTDALTRSTSNTLGDYTWLAPTRPDLSRFCAVRGYDAARALTPLVGGVELAAEPLHERALPLSCVDNADGCIPMADGSDGQTPTGTRAFAVGDVDGDGFDDVVIAGGRAGAPGTAALHLGSNTGLGLSPVARFVSSGTLEEFAQKVAALGDFNGDGYADFALSGQGLRMVFVVLGRDASRWPSRPVLVDHGGCATDLCIGHDRGTGAGLASAGDFDDDGTPDLALSAEASVVSVIRGSTTYRVNASLGGTATGSCLDARTITAGPNSTLNCSSASIPTGFHIHTPASPHLVQALGDRLYVSHRGTTNNAAVWAIRRRGYTQGSGLEPVGSRSSLTHIEIVHELGNSASGLFDRALMSIGDFDGDSLPDLAAGIDRSEGRLYVYPGQVNGKVAFSAGVPTSQVGYVLTNAESDAAGDFFGEEVGLGLHPIFGLQGDLDGDGFGDLLVSSAQDGLGIASVDVFYGSADKALARARASRDYAFDNRTLSHESDAGSNYMRRGQYIGDVDGDGYQDLAIVEENFSDANHDGRVLIIGECSAP